MLVPIYKPFPFKSVLVKTVCIEIVGVYRVLDGEVARWEGRDEVNDKGPFGLVFLEHSKDEVAQLLREGYLKGQWLFVQDFVHQTSNALVLEGRLQGCHVVHYNAQREDVGAVVVGLLFDDFRAEIQWCTDLFAF